MIIKDIRSKHIAANKKRGVLGFSLVELIVVISILAVLLALLVPSLMTYMETTRAQKDVSTMDEVVNAVQLALSDTNCYDEMLRYSCTNNYLTYTDSSGKFGAQIVDGEYWAPDGYGKATTITFNPHKDDNGKTYYTLDAAILNDMTHSNGSSGEKRIMENAIVDSQCYLKSATLVDGVITAHMYNAVRQTIGNRIDISSSIYANSSFTIFIKFNQKDKVTVADTEGSFNGTNLYKGAPASKGSGTTYVDDGHGNKVPVVNNPDGGTTLPNYDDSDLTGNLTLGGNTQEYKSNYYSSVALAIEDCNENTIGKRADVNRRNATAGISFTGSTYLITMYKDTTESVEISAIKNTTLDLNGYVLTTDCKISTQSEGCNIIDSTDGEGAIKTDGSNLYLQKSNAMMIFCSDDDEYHFTTLKIKTRSYLVYPEDKDFSYDFYIANDDNLFLRDQLYTRTFEESEFSMRMVSYYTRDGHDYYYYWYYDHSIFDDFRWEKDMFKYSHTVADDIENLKIQVEMVGGLGTEHEVIVYGTLVPYDPTLNQNQNRTQD